LSLGVAVTADDDGRDTVRSNVGPTRDFVRSALGSALWAFPNTFSLLLDGSALSGLNELMRRHKHLY
jgi:hypothetical protein